MYHKGVLIDHRTGPYLSKSSQRRRAFEATGLLPATLALWAGVKGSYLKTDYFLTGKLCKSFNP